MPRPDTRPRHHPVARAIAVMLGTALTLIGCVGSEPSAEPGAGLTSSPLALASAGPGPTATTEPTSQASAGSEAAVGPTEAALALAADGEPTPITFEEFYTRASIREGLKLSEKLLSLAGRKVVMRGYMAPPLKPELDFFVLTRIRLAYCPFCSTAAEWPDDIAVVYTPSPMKATERAVSVEGTIEVGSKMDAETGMVSLVRIYADRVDKL